MSPQSPWDAFRPQDPRQGQGQPQYPPPPYGQQQVPDQFQDQSPYPPQQPYGQQPPQPSFTPGPQHGPPAADPRYQGQPQQPYQQGQPQWGQQGPGQYQGQPPYQGQPYPPGAQPSYPGPGYGYGPQPPRGRRKRHVVRNIFGGTGAVIVAVIVISAALSHGSNGVSTAPSGGTASAAAASSPAATPRAAVARVGSYFDVQDASGDTYRVTLVKIIDPAKGADEFNTPESGKRFVGVVFTIKALKGSPQDEDANNDAAVVGGNGQTYTADLDDIAGYTNFSDGSINVAQGDSTTGAVVFQVPDGVKVTEVQWSAASGFGSTVQWNAQTPAAAAASTAPASSCSSQVSAWHSNGGAGRLKATFTDVEALSSAATKLGGDTASTPGSASDQQAAQDAAAKLQSDITAAEQDPAPSCIPGLRRDAQAFFADASATATAVSNAADAFGNADYTAESRNTPRIHCRVQSTRIGVAGEGVCTGQEAFRDTAGRADAGGSA